MILFFPYGGGTSVAAAATQATTVNQLIKDALSELGVVGTDGVMSPEDAASALRILRSMYGSFNAQRLFLFQVSRETFPLVNGQQAYTVGPDGDVDRERPNGLSHMGVIPVGETSEIPVRMLSRREWLAVADKTQTDGYPRFAFFDPTFPLGTLSVWPKPTTAATFVLAAAMALSNPASLNFASEIILPDEYYEAWRLELARRLNRPMGNFVRGDDLRTLQEDARRAVGVILRQNDPGPSPQTSDPAILNGGGRGGYDITTGRYTS